jgi:flagellar basal-body rod modification protein FlgD
MDISSISGISTVQETDLYAESATQEMDRDAFIKMFLAQMQNQDPLNPMDGTEFASQLAQFSSLEQLFNVNESLESLSTTQDNQARYEALSLIGKEVLLEGNQLALNGEDTARGAFDLDQSAECTVTISDDRGIPVRTLSLGTLQAGSHEFQWDGESTAGAEMPEGSYEFEITALTPLGESVRVTPKVLGTVDRVRLEGDTSTLYIGDLAVDLGSVLDVRLAEATSSGDASITTDASEQ